MRQEREAVIQTHNLTHRYGKVRPVRLSHHSKFLGNQALRALLKGNNCLRQERG